MIHWWLLIAASMTQLICHFWRVDLSNCEGCCYNRKSYFQQTLKSQFFEYMELSLQLLLHQLVRTKMQQRWMWGGCFSSSHPFLIIDPEGAEFGLPYSPYASLLIPKNSPMMRHPNITQLIQLFISDFKLKARTGLFNCANVFCVYITNTLQGFFCFGWPFAASTI